MTKQEVIDFIMEINKLAVPEFLATFSIEDLGLYLEHLMELDSITVTPDLNEWIQENGDELDLIYNEDLGISKERIQGIGNYVKDLEEGLCEWEYSRISMQTEYSKVYDTIKTLMDLSYKTKDRKLTPMLAYIELRARKCLDSIETRTAVRN